MKKGISSAMAGRLSQPADRGPAGRRILKIPGEVFAPILPAAAVSAFVLGLVCLAGNGQLAEMTGISFADMQWFRLLKKLAAFVFAFLPVLVAVSTARLFAGSVILAGLLGLCMVRPDLPEAWFAALPQILVKFFCLGEGERSWPVTLVILSVGMMCVVEKWLRRRLSAKTEPVLAPLCTVLISWPVSFLILGPLFGTLESWLGAAAHRLITDAGAIGWAITGAVYPLSVAMGLNHMYNGVGVQMLSAQPWKNGWMLIASAALFALAGAGIAAAGKTRDAGNRWKAVLSSACAVLGIWEPALFGISLRHRSAFLAGTAGAAAGSLFAFISGISGYTDGMAGTSGFFTVNSSRSFLIMALISAGTAFLLTWFTWKEEASGKDAAAEGAMGAEAPGAHQEPDRRSVYSPLKGRAVPAYKIPDALFSTGILGGGVGIEPEEGRVLAPFAGEVVSVSPTKQSVSLIGPDGMQVMIHAGVNTSSMNGNGFEVLTAEGDMVSRGDCLMTFDIGKIREAGCSTVCAVLLTNSDDYDDFRVLKLGEVGYGEELLTIEP